MGILAYLLSWLDEHVTERRMARGYFEWKRAKNKALLMKAVEEIEAEKNGR